MTLALQQRRERMQSLSAAQRERLSRLETSILAQLDRAAQALAGQQQAVQERRDEFERRTSDEDSRSAAVHARATELDLLAQNLDRRAAELAAREIAIADRESDVQKSVAAPLAEVERRRQTVDARSAELDRQAVDLKRQEAAHAAACEAAFAQQADMEKQFAQRQALLEATKQEIDAAAAKLLEKERAAKEERHAAAQEQLQIKRQADERQAALAREAAEIASQREQLNGATEQHRQAVLSADRLREGKEQELTQLKKRTDEKLQSLEREWAMVTHERERTDAQRLHIAEQFKRDRTAERQIAAERLSELQTLASQGRVVQEALLADIRQECQRLSERLLARDDELSAEVKAHDATRRELAALVAQLDGAGSGRAAAESMLESASADATALRRQLAALEAERDQWRERCEAQTALSESGSDAELRTHELLNQMTTERDQLRRKLADAETALAESEAASENAASGADSSEMADLTQRYEMAVRDIRELKKKNEDLEKRTANSRQAPPALGGPLNWEAQKRQLLASLEADEGGEDEPERHAERLRIADVVEQTDSLLREREQEIEELRSQLESDASKANLVAASDAAIVAGVLDKDEILIRERARLKELETEWEGKLRQAEITISVERAQLARAQAQLAEKQRTLEDRDSVHDAREAQEAGTKPKVSQRGRWLSRLGLSDDEK
ncbi:MAG TPA: hypothetical protein VGN12_14810 [Pirellulales bacterium]